MNLTKRAKIAAGSLAAAGALTLAGGAFTATGIALSGTAAVPQFVGGAVSQTVTGATLDEIKYGFDPADPANKTVNSVQLTFAGAEADGQTVTVDTGTGVGAWTCGVIGTPTTKVATCTSAGLTGINNIDIVVSSTF